MKIKQQPKEIIQLSFPNRQIHLNQAQLFFLENYIRKQHKNFRLCGGLRLRKGGLEFSWIPLRLNEKSLVVIKKVSDYLIAFQGEAFQLEPKCQIHIKMMKIHFQPVLTPKYGFGDRPYLK